MIKSIVGAEVDSLDVAGVGRVTKGTRLVHPHFGRGVVVALFQMPAGGVASHTIGIEFESAGYKALSPEFANLKLV